MSTTGDPIGEAWVAADIEALEMQVQSWKAKADTLKHEVERLREQLTALREYVREKANPDEILNEPGGIPQINFRAGMVTAYRDIEKLLTEMEGKQV